MFTEHIHGKFWTKFAQKVFPVEKVKSEHHHRISHIQIGLGNKLFYRTFFFQHFYMLKISKNNFRKITTQSYVN